MSYNIFQNKSVFNRWANQDKIINKNDATQWISTPNWNCRLTSLKRCLEKWIWSRIVEKCQRKTDNINIFKCNWIFMLRFWKKKSNFLTFSLIDFLLKNFQLTYVSKTVFTVQTCVVLGFNTIFKFSDLSWMLMPRTPFRCTFPNNRLPSMNTWNTHMSY